MDCANSTVKMKTTVPFLGCPFCAPSLAAGSTLAAACNDEAAKDNTHAKESRNILDSSNNLRWN